MHESRSFRILRAVGLTGLTIFTVLPLYVLFSTAAKPLGDVQNAFRWIPSTFTVAAFVDIWSTVPLARYFLNSVIVAGTASVVSVALAVLAAYAISRYTFRGRELFRMAVLSTQMFPGILFLLPLFLIYVNIGQLTGLRLNGNLSGLIIASRSPCRSRSGCWSGTSTRSRATSTRPGWSTARARCACCGRS